MKNTYRILFTACSAASILLAGCGPTKTASFGSSKEVLGYGVYTAKGADASGYTVKLSLNQNGSYSKKKFQGSCMLVESKGEWKGDEQEIEFRLQEVRIRPDCDTEDWQVEKKDLTSPRMLRNVTTRSFELLDQDENTSAEWQKFVKG